MAGFGAAMNRALSLLEHRGRVSQRALKLELGLDEETFEPPGETGAAPATEVRLPELEPEPYSRSM